MHFFQLGLEAINFLLGDLVKVAAGTFTKFVKKQHKLSKKLKNHLKNDQKSFKICKYFPPA